MRNFVHLNNKIQSMAKKSIINTKSEKFLEKYINNASPTGFESAGQKVWLDYIKPYVDEYFVDTLRVCCCGNQSKSKIQGGN